MELLYLLLLLAIPAIILGIIGFIGSSLSGVANNSKNKANKSETDIKEIYKQKVLERDHFTCRSCGRKDAKDVTTPTGEDPNIVCFSVVMDGNSWRTILRPGASLDEMITVCSDCKHKLEHRHYQPLKEKVLERDNFKCLLCGKPATEVMIQYSPTYRVYLDNSKTGIPDSDHISLCINCKLETITPTDFEKVVGQAFEKSGYKVKRTGGPGDQGIDLVCEHLLRNEKLIVQCKRYNGKVGVEVVRDFYGTLINSKLEKGFIVTTGEFTSGAKNWAEGKGINLIDGTELINFLSGNKIN